MMGTKLLKSRASDELQDHDIEEIIRKLTSELFFHGHPINRNEARDDVGLKFVADATPAVRDRMWDLYSLYAAENRLDEPWIPMQEAIGVLVESQGQNLPPMPGGFSLAPHVKNVSLPTIRAVSVDSKFRSDVFEQNYNVTVNCDPNSGAMNGNVGFIGQGWREEVDGTDDEPAPDATDGQAIPA
jgi:hypothetical protein